MNSILILALLLFTVVLIVGIAPKIRSKAGSLITWKRSLILAGLYLGILIMSYPILYLLPDKDFIKLVEISKEEVNYQLFEGNFDQQPGLYKNSRHDYKVDNNKLTFDIVANLGNYRIFVERKDVDDGQIEVSTYAEAQFVDGIDITELVLPPIITVQNGILSLQSSQEQRLNFKQFKMDFTAAQLKNRNGWLNRGGMYSDFGMKLIYIRVPKNMDINKGNNDYEGRIQMLSK